MEGQPVLNRYPPHSEVRYRADKIRHSKSKKDVQRAASETT